MQIPKVVRSRSIWTLVKGHLELLRVDHWTKNVFVLPGMIVALAVPSFPETAGLALRVLTGLLATSLVASSNYVINEVMDAPYDAHHPEKRKRPIPSGRASVAIAYAQWVSVGAAGIGLGLTVSPAFAITMFVFWLLGVAYNVPPLRTKEWPYLDVASESMNNPVRFLAGWFVIRTAAFPPTSILIAYWMVGCYFMALKRLAEYRDLDDPERAARYRRSFGYYDVARLLVSVQFYAAAAMLFFGAFIVRYKLELVLSFPLVAAVMAIYMRLSLKPNSPVQEPERLYSDVPLVISVAGCIIIMVVLLFVDIPIFQEIFHPGLIRWGS